MAWAQKISGGHRPYYTVYFDSSPNIDIIPFLTMISWDRGGVVGVAVLSTFYVLIERVKTK